MQETRLNKALADSGLCSRRKADELIFAGAVQVNGAVEMNPGRRVVLGQDSVLVHDKPLAAMEETPCLLMLHKPVGVVCTASDPEGRPTVLDLVPPKWQSRRLYPVGRLDFFSEGLILITDDGPLANRLSHPRWHLPRIYRVRVRPERPCDRAELERKLNIFRQGMVLAEGERLAPVATRIIPEKELRDGALLEMELHQGINRQIRRMCRDAGLIILKLKRISQGPLLLGTLPLGEARELSPEELRALRQSVGL